jgi:hypothetical protein
VSHGIHGSVVYYNEKASSWQQWSKIGTAYRSVYSMNVDMIFLSKAYTFSKFWTHQHDKNMSEKHLVSNPL